MSNTLKRFLFSSDYHGDSCDRKAARALLDFKKIWKPHINVFGGDLWDFRSMRKGASEEDKGASMLADYNMGVDFLHELKPNVFIHGNHDNRLWFLRDHANGLVQDMAAKLCTEIDQECKKLKCRVLPYHRERGILRVGRLKMLHGFFCGINAARQHALWCGSSLFGHVHTIDVASIPTNEGPRVARSVGCLCDLDMSWDNTRPTGMRQAHGWAYGYVDEHTGLYKVYQAEQLGGRWLLPTEFTEI